MADDAFRILDKLQITGSKVQTAAGDVAMGNAGVCVVNKTSGAATAVTLTARAKKGMFAFVKDGKGDAATNNITVSPDGTSNNTTIDGGSSFVISVNYGAAMFFHNGTEWNMIGMFDAALSQTELGYLDGVTPGTQAASKAIVNDTHANQGAIKATSLAIGTSGSEVALAATIAEINAACDVSARLVSLTTSTLTVTSATHSGKIVVLDSTHTQTVTLPASSGGGDIYTFMVKTTSTDGSKIIQVANTTDVIAGASWAANTQNTIDTFITSATSDTVTMNNTTQGGVAGTRVVITDIASGTFHVHVQNITTGNPATPFSASV